jgi:hypothetical protein
MRAGRKPKTSKRKPCNDVSALRLGAWRMFKSRSAVDHGPAANQRHQPHGAERGPAQPNRARVQR